MVVPRRVDEDLMEQFLAKLRNIAGRTPEKIEAFDRTASRDISSYGTGTGSAARPSPIDLNGGSVQLQSHPSLLAQT